MTDVESRTTTVPDHVERDGFVWNLIDRGDGTWGIQQGLGHQGELSREKDPKTAVLSWRVVTKAIPYMPPEEGFGTWNEAIDHFLTTAGSDAIDDEMVDTEAMDVITENEAADSAPAANAAH